MAVYVMVHGAWHGAWCWQRVRRLLVQAGHEVFTPCLTGVGERAHLLSNQVRLATHVQDVVADIEMNELQDVILVGHSYGGMVITGVADRLGSRLRHLVYVDAVVPLSGESWSSRHTRDTQAARRQQITTCGGAMPAMDPSPLGLSADDEAWVRRRLTAHPGSVYDDPLVFDEAAWQSLPRTFIDCTAPALPTVAIMRQRVRQNGGWRVHELPTGHDPMISAPEAFTELLLAVACP